MKSIFKLMKSGINKCITNNTYLIPTGVIPIKE